MSATTREVEVKLDVEPSRLPRLEAHPLLAESKAGSHTLPSVYFDTGNFDLRDAGLSLRVRQTEGSYVQTIKSSISRNSLYRGEWEARSRDRTQTYAQHKIRL
jgi:triphosphatase